MAMRLPVWTASALLSFVAIACGRSSLDAPEAPELDAGTESGPDMPAMLQSCDELAAGGVPDALQFFVWSLDPASCPDDSCYDAVVIDPTTDPPCTLRLKEQSDPGADAVLQLPSEDCVAARSWVSNLQFLGVLRTGVGCEGGPGMEEFYVGVNAPFSSYADRMTNSCSEPTIDAVRACLRGLVARLRGAH